MLRQDLRICWTACELKLPVATQRTTPASLRKKIELDGKMVVQLAAKGCGLTLALGLSEGWTAPRMLADLAQKNILL